MVMNNIDKISELGLVGEKIVVNMLNKLHPELRIVFSTNKYDNEKDMLVDDKKVEVKTQSPFIMKNAFTFRPNQLKKCQSVDVLYIVSVPHPTWKHHSDGWVYRVVPSEFKYQTWVDKKGISRILIPINQPAVIQVHKIDDDDIKELMKYSTTGY
jgi:hypothetical protein